MTQADLTQLTEIGDRRSAILRGLAFSPELKRIFEGGIRLRDDPAFPGRKYFLAHAARELRRDLHKHVTKYITIVQGVTKSSIKQPTLSSETAKRWVAEVSSRLESFADADVPADHVISVSADLAAVLDPYMRKEAAVSDSLRERMRAGYDPLAQFVPAETLAAAVIAMHKMDPDKYTHVRELDVDFSDAEVTTLWDKLEALLFDLFGANAWAYRSIDVTVDMLNDL